MSVPEGYKSLGKIGISYKGDYNSNTAYERLDAVFHNGSTYLAIKDAPDGAPRDDKTNWIYLAKGYDGETVDVADSEIAFTDSETRENIVSGEKVSTVFGKIKKFFTDLTAPAFAQMITSADDLLATKVTGYVPDAKAVADGFADVNGKLGKYKLSTCGFFSINLVVGSNIVSVDKLVSGSLPQTPYTLFTVISQGTSLNRLIDIFFDGGNNVVAYTSPYYCTVEYTSTYREHIAANLTSGWKVPNGSFYRENPDSCKPLKFVSKERCYMTIELLKQELLRRQNQQQISLRTGPTNN